MSLTSVWYLNHSGSTLSDENWSSKVDVINRKLECSTVKHSSDGLPGENKVIKGVWLEEIKTAWQSSWTASQEKEREGTAQFKGNFREVLVFWQFNGICRTMSAAGPHISSVWGQRKYSLRLEKDYQTFWQRSCRHRCCAFTETRTNKKFKK